MLTGVCGPHVAPLRGSQTPRPRGTRVRREAPEPDGPEPGSGAGSVSAAGSAEPRPEGPRLESKTRTIAWDKDGRVETAPADAGRGDPTTRMLAPGPRAPFTEETQGQIGAQDLRPQTAPNPVTGDRPESMPSSGCLEPQELAGPPAPDFRVQRCLLPYRRNGFIQGQQRLAQRVAAGGTRAQLLRGTARLLLAESPLDRAGSRKCAGFSLAGLLLGREKNLPSRCRGGGSCPWVGGELWAPHSTRVVSLRPYWNVGLGALAQALGHTLGRAAVSAATLGKQQVPPLNLLWGGGWLPPSQVGCSEHPAGPPDAPGTQPTLLPRAAPSHRPLRPSIPATNTRGIPTQAVPRKMAGEGKPALWGLGHRKDPGLILASPTANCVLGLCHGPLS
ncbi:uncharacterized protein LOC106006601 [Mustela putorius furo]|uniref:Uncharacterized protein LOC106006601 n=1 Tax=Mustela putorius furo TaxID=9669 RepID=A0A8U0V5X8_MUSPF|nr:uncharacterized protein LOC106006601 [Mustela putorius furo]XP_044939114.1 uncharacterized protein LOC106006601 [Mustela putorius furo]